MNKEITINFSYAKHQYLITFFEDGLLRGWEFVADSKEVQKLIADYYFPDGKLS